MPRWYEIVFRRFSIDFDFSKGHPTHFWKSQWESFSIEDETTHEPSKGFILYRGIYCLAFVSAIIYSTTCQSDLYFIFLTNWSFLSQTIYSILSFSMLIHEWAQRNLISKTNKTADRETDVNVELNVVKVEKDGYKTESDDTRTSEENKYPPVPINIIHKLLWIMTNIVYVLPYGVAGGYWLVVYNPNTVNAACEKFRSHYIVHGMNTVMALLDSFVSAVHIRLFHCVFPTALVGIYCFFTFIYEASGGRYREEKEYIYSILNWRSYPSKALATSCLAIAVTPIGHFIFCYSLHKLKRWTHAKITRLLK